jgi:hypothetical protein
MSEMPTVPAGAQPSQGPPPDPWAARFRERVAAGIAAAVIVTLLGLLIVAVAQAGSDETFQRLKDLLLFVNPLVGYVIGYYFHKVATEARAERAETVADSATRTAEEAVQSRDQATTRAEELRGSLDDLERAVDSTIAPAGAPGVLSGDGASTTADPATDPRLLAALGRARRALGRATPVP